MVFYLVPHHNQTMNLYKLDRILWMNYFVIFCDCCRCVNEGGPAHAKRFTFAVRVNTTDRGWTDECIGEPMPSVKKAKDSAAVLLLELLSRWYSI